jgi:hypothetical protein
MRPIFQSEKNGTQKWLIVIKYNYTESKKNVHSLSMIEIQISLILTDNLACSYKQKSELCTSWQHKRRQYFQPLYPYDDPKDKIHIHPNSENKPII